MLDQVGREIGYRATGDVEMAKPFGEPHISTHNQ